MQKRDKAVESFQNSSKTKLFCGNIVAAGTGLTLTAADTLMFGELSYVPAEHAQASDRHHRIGQVAENVSCHYLIADNTLEEKVCEMLHSKMQTVDQILDGKITDSDGWDFKKELFRTLKQK
jgi:SNF2 family DNA or RNA helicase